MITSMKYFIIILFMLLVSCGRDVEEPGLIEIDTGERYPISDLKLSDVAQVQYIPLKMGKDSLYLAYPGSICVVGETFFLNNSNLGSPPSQIVRYDMSGNVIGLIDKLGNGPEEYIRIGNYSVDSPAKEIFIYDPELCTILVYDFDGKFKRSVRPGVRYYTFCDMDGDYLMGFTPNNRWFKPPNMRVRDKSTSPLSFIEKKSLEVTLANFDYPKPRDMGSVIIYNHFSKVPDGVYVTCERSDTIYHIDRKCEISPRIVDVTPYQEKRTQIYPVLETDRYIFLSKEFESKKEQPSISEWKPFVYDKLKRKLFRLNVDIGKYKSTSLALINNQIALWQFYITQNPNYAAVILSPQFLHENYKHLPAELKEITSKLKEDDNPVLMLIKFI